MSARLSSRSCRYRHRTGLRSHRWRRKQASRRDAPTPSQHRPLRRKKRSVLKGIKLKGVPDIDYWIGRRNPERQNAEQDRVAGIGVLQATGNVRIGLAGNDRRLEHALRINACRNPPSSAQRSGCSLPAAANQAAGSHRMKGLYLKHERVDLAAA